MPTDVQPKYEIIINEKVFDPAHEQRRGSFESEPQLFVRVLTVELTKLQYEQVKKAVLENW